MVRTKVVTVMMWYVQDEVNQEESEQNEVDKGSWFHRWGDAYWEERLIHEVRLYVQGQYCLLFVWLRLGSSKTTRLSLCFSSLQLSACLASRACWPVNQLDLAPRYAGETIHRTSVSLWLYFWARSLYKHSNMHRLKGELNEHNITKVRHRAYSLDKNTIFIWVIWLSRRWWRLTAFMTVNFSTLGNWTITVSN